MYENLYFIVNRLNLFNFFLLFMFYCHPGVRIPLRNQSRTYIKGTVSLLGSLLQSGARRRGVVGRTCASRGRIGRTERGSSCNAINRTCPRAIRVRTRAPSYTWAPADGRLAIRKPTARSGNDRVRRDALPSAAPALARLIPTRLSSVDAVLKLSCA